jgi:hypothetical protein
VALAFVSRSLCNSNCESDALALIDRQIPAEPPALAAFLASMRAER